MNTNLPERSIIIKNLLEHIVNTIKKSAKDKIAMIILFGSYARGNWVSDVYTEGHITYSYQSDIDIFIVLRKAKDSKNYARKLEERLEKRLEREFESKSWESDPSPSFVIEPITHFNEQLSKGRYFYYDIVKEGILLYDNQEFTLAEARKLPWSERREIAQEDYDNWFGLGTSFLINCNHALERNDFKISAFELHQATEHFYHTILLVFDGYKPKLHDIAKLNKKARRYGNEFYTIFPCATSEQKECFELLRAAYIEARYNKHYKISKEQLLYLIERVKKLQVLTEEICIKKLGS